MQTNSTSAHVAVIGGGLAGLVSAILLTRQGYRVVLVEKKAYPFHRVCGEYISCEVYAFMQYHRLLPSLEHTHISKLMVSAPDGTALHTTLPLGGFGISRYSLDHYLADTAVREGVELITRCAVTEIDWDAAEENFSIQLHGGGTVRATVVLGAFGKRSTLDKQLNRPFFVARSPYIGVKYHIRTQFPDDLIALHNFKNGYCGISKVEGERFNLCYLSSRENLRAFGSIEEMEKNVLWHNPFLKEIFNSSEFLFEKPEVINEISFAPKACVENHILMVGDAAGLITPLCGNGMAMAIHGAILASQLIVRHYQPGGKPNRVALEQEYTQSWQRQFSGRLWFGRAFQRLFGAERLTNAAIRSLRHLPPLLQWMVRQTHGREVSPVVFPA